MNLRLYIICLAAVFALVSPVLADSTATVHGGVYGWDTFEPLENAIVEVNSTPSQSMLAKYALYSFELEPGDYNITAKYYQNGTLIYSGEESIEIEGEGNYVRDLLLLPVYSEDLMGEGNSSSENPNGNIKDPSEKPVPQVTKNEANNSSNTNFIEQMEANFSISGHLLGIFALILLLSGVYWLSTKRNRTDKNLHPGKKPEHVLKTELIKSGSDEPLKAIEPVSQVPDKKEEPEINQTNRNETDINQKNEKMVSLIDPAAQTIKDKTTNSSPQIETSISIKKAPLSSNSEIETEIETESEIKERESQIESSEKYPAEKPEFIEYVSKEEVQKSSIEPSTVNDSVDSPKETSAFKKKPSLPEDLQEVMDIIMGQGGRITQKNLRSRLKYSEGKVSLMLADLERRELIEKFKMGRGNIVVVKDGKR